MDDSFRIGDFTVEPQLNRIRRGDRKVQIESKAMEVLVYLSQHPKEVLPKERIIQAVWPDVSVTDDVLTHAISELRKAFEDDAREPRFIQTIPRKGYRLVAVVSQTEPARAQEQSGRSQSNGGPVFDSAATSKRNRHKLIVAAAMFGRRQNLAWGGVLLVAVVLAGFSGWMLRPEPPAPDPIRLEANVSGGQPLYTGAGGLNAALSPDGRLLAFVAGTETRGLHIRSLDRLESEILQGTERARAPFFSPDGLWLGFFVEGEGLKKVSISGGTPLSLCPSGLAGGATWREDGTIVFAQNGSGLMEVSAGGGTPRELTRLAGGENGHYSPQFLPGGRHVLFFSWDFGAGTIEVVDVQTKQRKEIHQGGGRQPRYAASGHLLYVESGTLFAASFDLDALEISAEPVPVLQGVAGNTHYDVSPNGTLVYLRGGSSERRTLVWLDENGTVTPASKTRRDYGSFQRLSPDGKRLAVSIDSNDNTDVWVVDLERDLQTRVTSQKAVDSFPIWSPDGRSIYFHSVRAGKAGIYLKQADGSGETELLLESDTATLAVRDVSRDGKYLAYCSPGAGRGSDVFLLPLGGGASPESFVATSADEGSPRFAPDGGWMAYDSDETGRYEVYVGRFPGPGRKVQVSGDGGFRPQWSDDGRRLFYRTDDAIWLSLVKAEGEALQVGKAKRLVALEGAYDRSLAVAPDGRRFLLIGREQEQAGDLHRLTFVFNWFDELRRLVPTD